MSELSRGDLLDALSELRDFLAPNGEGDFRRLPLNTALALVDAAVASVRLVYDTDAFKNPTAVAEGKLGVIYALRVLAEGEAR